jgi:hypothetical protein
VRFPLFLTGGILLTSSLVTRAQSAPPAPADTAALTTAIWQLLDQVRQFFVDC